MSTNANKGAPHADSERPRENYDPLLLSPETGEGETPRYDESIKFLRWFAPSGPWCLVAIAVDRKGLVGITFHPGQEAQIRTWLTTVGKDHNVYFSVNPVIRDLNTKPRREDIAAMEWLHVDIDPRVGEDLDEERARILALLREFDPAPSCIIFSGGGYQAFWRLDEPFKIDGRPELYEQAKRWNLQLELLLGGDACHNVDRIMRLPGTINRPDAKKLKKGRTKALAHVVEQHDDRVYTLDQFQPAAEVAVRGKKATVEIRGDAPRVTDLNELPVGDLCKVVIAQGKDPDNPGKWSSRSEPLFFVCCALVRAGVEDERIYSIITDPDWAISESVLDKQSGAGRYARRQIERAHDFAEDDAIAKINREYFAALDGGRTVFCREEEDGSLTTMNREAFTFELADRKETVMVRETAQEIAAVKLWLSSERRRYYRRGFVLDPTEGNDPEAYNLWKGFGVEPRAGDWSRLRMHAEQILASGNAAHADYILRWTAFTLQNPATPPRVALVFRGDEGVGKGVWCNALVRAFGPHGQRLQSMNQVAGRFNAHFRHLCLLFADEAVLPNPEHEGTLRGIITEPTLPIEGKGKDIVHAENHLHVVMASNSDWVVPASIGARRFAVFDVPADRKGDHQYFLELWSQIDDGGLAAMVHELLAWDLGNWHPEAARPDTAALVRQKIQSLAPLERMLFECLETGELPAERPLGDGALLSSTSFVREVQKRTRREDVTANKLKTLLGDRLGFRQRTDTRPRGWELPPLPEARQRWVERVFPFEWNDADAWHLHLPPF